MLEMKITFLVTQDKHSARAIIKTSDTAQLTNKLHHVVSKYMYRKYYSMMTTTITTVMMTNWRWRRKRNKLCEACWNDNW
jgi:hypothetical protein